MKGDYLKADELLKEVNKGYHGKDYPYGDEFVISKEYLLKSSNTLVYPLTYIANLLAWSDDDPESITKLEEANHIYKVCLLYTSPSPRDATLSRMPSSA